MFLAESTQAGRPDFFLTFKNELHIVLQQVVLHNIFKSFCLNESLPFVVVRAACPDVSFFDNGFKWLGWHHVVMSVNKDGFGTWVDYFLSIDHGIAVRGHHFRLVCSGCQQQFFPAFSTTHHVGFMLRLCADTWDADEAEQLVEHPRFVFLDKFFNHDI